MLGFTDVLFILWLYHKVIQHNSLAFRMMLIVASVATVFIHPVVCISLIIGLSAVGIFRLGISLEKRDNSLNIR